MRKLSILFLFPLCLSWSLTLGCVNSPDNQTHDSFSAAESGEISETHQDLIVIHGEPWSFKEKLLFSVPWGKEGGELGKEDVGGRPGPMSIALDDHGNIVVADSINGQIKKFDEEGHVQKILNIGEVLPEHVSVDSEDHIRVLLYDSLEVAYRVVRFDENGQEIENLDVNVPQPTEVFGVGETTFVESRHEWVYTISSENQEERNKWEPFAKGRPDAGDPRVFWAATKANAHSGGEVLLNASNPAGRQIRSILLRPKGRLLSLFSLDTDTEGNIYVGFYVEDRAELAIISPEGELIGHLPLRPIRYTGSKRFVAVSRNGRVVEMRTSAEEVTFVELEWRI